MKTIYNIRTGAPATATDEDAEGMVKYCGYTYANPLGPKQEVVPEVELKQVKSPIKEK